MNGIRMNFEDILLSVEKPSRYTGGEVNAVRKDRGVCDLSVALAFPDTYEVGMSHLGLQILYAILNNHPRIVAERVLRPLGRTWNGRCGVTVLSWRPWNRTRR